MGNPSTTVLPRSPLLRTVEGERLLALAEATAPNEVLTYERVRAELGFNPQSNAGRSLWSKVQAELESRGMQFSTEPKIGYRQVVLTRYRARVVDRPDAWTGSLRRMGTVVIDHRQVVIDGYVAARSTCGLTASGPWYSLDLSVSVDGFRVIEHWSLVRPDMEAHRLENDEVPIEVRCVALAGVALV